MLIGLPTFAVDSAKMMVKATNAPGVRELKGSLCAAAAVTDLDVLHHLGVEVTPNLGPRKTPEVRFNVACFVNDSAKMPTCDDVAKVYVHATGAQPAEINVVVRIGRARQTSRLQCSKLYSATGESLGDVPEILD